ncbi:MAG: hypothetical protein ABFR97_07330 [Thermodesulfobacteriota bacterium]
MKELLQEIKMLKGVLGVFVYSGPKGIIASDVPNSFREPSLKRMGQFTQLFFANRVARQQRFTSMEVKNDESLLMLKKVDDVVFLVTICEANASMPLVNMTTSMLLSELKSAAAAPSPPPPPPPVSPVAAPPAAKAKPAPAASAPPAAAPVDLNKLLNEGPFAATARKLEDAMSRAIGPVGVMVVRDCVEKWVANGAPAKNRFNELLGLLLKEIGDRELENEFKREVGPLLK